MDCRSSRSGRSAVRGCKEVKRLKFKITRLLVDMVLTPYWVLGCERIACWLLWKTLDLLLIMSSSLLESLGGKHGLAVVPGQ